MTSRAVRVAASARSALRPSQNNASAERVGNESRRSICGSRVRRAMAADPGRTSLHRRIAEHPHVLAERVGRVDHQLSGRDVATVAAGQHDGLVADPHGLHANAWLVPLRSSPSTATGVLANSIFGCTT